MKPSTMILPVLLGLATHAAAQPTTTDQPTEQPTAQAGDRLPSAEAIIHLAIEAHGGKEAHAALKTRKARGSYRQSNDTFEADVFLFQQRKRLRASETLKYSGELIVRVVGEENAWLDFNGHLRPMFGKAKAQTQRAAAFDGLTDWQEFYKTAETVGAEQLDGKAVRVVRMTAEDDLFVDWIFDAESHMLVAKREMRHFDDERAYLLLVKYSGYKAFDGIMLPTKVEEIQGEGEKQLILTWKYKSYQHNVRIPPGTFDTPADIQALIDEKSSGG